MLKGLELRGLTKSCIVLAFASSWRFLSRALIPARGLLTARGLVALVVLMSTLIIPLLLIVLLIGLLLLDTMDVGAIHCRLPWQLASLTMGRALLAKLFAMQAPPRSILVLHGSHNGAKKTTIARMM